jgi:hypothetical protein
VPPTTATPKPTRTTVPRAVVYRLTDPGVTERRAGGHRFLETPAGTFRVIGSTIADDAVRTWDSEKDGPLLALPQTFTDDDGRSYELGSTFRPLIAADGELEAIEAQAKARARRSSATAPVGVVDGLRATTATPPIGRAAHDRFLAQFGVLSYRAVPVGDGHELLAETADGKLPRLPARECLAERRALLLGWALGEPVACALEHPKGKAPEATTTVLLGVPSCGQH